MNTRTIIKGTAIILVLTCFSVPSYAGPEHQYRTSAHEDEMFPRHQQRMNMGRMMHHFSHLDLTDEQTLSIKNLIKDGFEQGKAKRGVMKTLHHQKRTLTKSDIIDEQAIRTLGVEIANIKSDLMIMRLNKRREVEALLDEQQVTKLKAMKAEHEGRRRREEPK
ncbi:MAG: hypothetical protein KUG78_16645 [Kangiellaceae bacterium]|nr:hypothetical protein [Kangiellaceae bacterium]